MMHALAILLATTTAVDAGAPAPDDRPRPMLLAPVVNKPQAPAGDVYQLRRAKDGSHDLLYDAPGFTARVARDGSVTFHDKVFALSALSLFGPRVLRTPAMGAPSLQSLLRDGPSREPPPTPAVQQDTAGSYGSHLPIPTTTPYRPDPREACVYPRPCFFDAPVVLVSATISLDLTDQLLRLAGQDPYRYAKGRFLAGTSELRTRLAARAAADDVRESRAELPGRLVAIRCDERLGVAERRAILLNLKDELDPAAPGSREIAAAIDAALADLARPGGRRTCPPAR
jgi:hypothetical protein